MECPEPIAPALSATYVQPTSLPRRYPPGATGLRFLRSPVRIARKTHIARGLEDSDPWHPRHGSRRYPSRAGESRDAVPFAGQLLLEVPFPPATEGAEIASRMASISASHGPSFRRYATAPARRIELAISS